MSKDYITLRNPGGRVVTVTAAHGKYLLGKKNSGYAVAPKPHAKPSGPHIRFRPVVNLDQVGNSAAGLPGLVLGRGPSLSELDRDSIVEIQLEGLVIGINDLIRSHFKFLDGYVFADAVCFQIFQKEIARFDRAIFTSDRHVSRARAVGDISTIPMKNGMPTMDNFADGKALHISHTSALPALELAVLAGCDPIFIAGVDLQLFPDGSTHGAGARKCAMKPARYQQELSKMLKGFQLVAAWAKKNKRTIYKTSKTSLLPFPVKTIKRKKYA